jgi:hypothetical protein
MLFTLLALSHCNTVVVPRHGEKCFRKKNFRCFDGASKVSFGLPKFRFCDAVALNGIPGMFEWPHMKVHSNHSNTKTLRQKLAQLVH